MSPESSASAATTDGDEVGCGCRSARLDWDSTESSPSRGMVFGKSYQRNNSHTNALPDIAAARSALRSRSRSVDSELKNTQTLFFSHNSNLQLSSLPRAHRFDFDLVGRHRVLVGRGRRGTSNPTGAGVVIKRLRFYVRFLRKQLKHYSCNISLQPPQE